MPRHFFLYFFIAAVLFPLFWSTTAFGDGDEGDRTPDPLLAKQVLSQLSYIPNKATLVSRTAFSSLLR
jgi:hypothetical protein